MSSRILGRYGNSRVDVINPITDPVNTQLETDSTLSNFNFSANSVTLPSSQNLFTGSGRLLVFNCDIILTGPSSVSATRTTFYDTSGTPTGSEPVLFSIISFAQKVTGVTEGYSQHAYTFPSLGLVFNEGVGIQCEVIVGTPSILQVEAMFGYVAT